MPDDRLAQSPDPGVDGDFAVFVAGVPGDASGRRLAPGDRHTSLLAAREMDALRAYARVGSQKVVATELGVAVQTVKNHMSSAYRKLEVSTAVEAFVILGWLRPPDDAPGAAVDDVIRAAELRAQLIAIANEAGAIASRLGDLVERSA